LPPAGLAHRLLHGTALTLCFALPVVGYMGYSAVILHYGFELSNMGDAYLYGRTAHAADCATLKIPADERPLCPSPPVAATLGVDGLVNAHDAPRVRYQPANVQLGVLINTLPLQRQLAYSVLRQQPVRVIGDIAKDSVKIFALTRDTDEGDTPIWRWQFQTSYPTYPRASPSTARTAPARSSPEQARRARSRQPDRGHRAAGLPAARRVHARAGFPARLLVGLAGIFTYGRRREPGAEETRAWPGLPADHQLRYRRAARRGYV